MSSHPALSRLPPPDTPDPRTPVTLRCTEDAVSRATHVAKDTTDSPSSKPVHGRASTHLPHASYELHTSTAVI